MTAADEMKLREIFAAIAWELDDPGGGSLTPYVTDDARITVCEHDGRVVRFSAEHGDLDAYITYRRAGAWLFDRQQWACDLMVDITEDSATVEAVVFDIGWAKGVRSNVILASQVVRDRFVRRDGRWLLDDREVVPVGSVSAGKDVA